MRSNPANPHVTLIGVLMLGFSLIGCNETFMAPERKPNVILIFVDTLRADHLGSYGYKRDTTPSLDRFAAESLLFRNAIAHAPWTSPSIASALTSRYPGEIGYVDNKQLPILDDRFLLLPEIFAANGYKTTAIVSHLFISRKAGFAQGFERFDETNSLGHDHVSSPSIVDKASHFLVDSRDAPFFLFLHFFDPHFAYKLHEPYDFDPEYVDSLDPVADQREMLTRIASLDNAELHHLRALYDSEIRYTDDHLGRLFEMLRDRKLYKDALIVVTADHGEEFREREEPHIGHSKTLYQELIHIPLLIKLPGSSKGRVIENLVGLIDLAPSLVETLDLEVPADHEFEGRALPLRKSSRFEKLPEAPVFSETKNSGSDLQSVTLGRWKLIADHKAERSHLYDLRADPGERNDLAASTPEVVETYTGLLTRWADRVRFKKLGYRSMPTELTPEEIEQLRDLGYAD